MSVIAKIEIDKRMQHLRDACRASGTKLTHQRSEIYRELAQTDDHPDAEMIYERVRKRIPGVSLDTVYRTLWTLKEVGLIDTLGPGRERTRFDANLDRHHHFVCVACGLTRDFVSESFNKLQLPKSIKNLGTIKTTMVEARGICPQCRKKTSSKISNNRSSYEQR